MKEAISVLSGRAETVRRLDAIRARVGDDPSNWLPLYLEDENENYICRAAWIVFSFSFMLKRFLGIVALSAAVFLAAGLVAPISSAPADYRLLTSLP